MKRGWLGWALAGLLLASVLVGLVAESPRSAAADPPAQQAEVKHDHDLPHFECEDRTGVPYEITAEKRQQHVAWMQRELDLSDDQGKRMISVFDDAAFRADEFWRQTRDEYCSLRDRLFADARAVMTEDQIELLGEKIRDRNESLNDEPNPQSEPEGPTEHRR